MNNNKILIIICCFALSAGIFFFFRKKEVTEKEAIQSTMEQINSNNKLDSYEKALLPVELAVVDYTMKHENNPPESLSDLVPTYFTSVPLNPKTKKPFEYKRNGDSYIIGNVDNIELASNETKSKGKAKSKDGFDDLSEEEFVNPNQMEAVSFVYDNSTKRDPFVPFNLSKKSSVDSKAFPLTTYTLGQLRATAILKGGDGNYFSIVENSEGKGFTVKKGTKIGDAGGEVVEITADRIKIIESYVNFKGEKVTNTAEMKLQGGGGSIKKKNSKTKRKKIRNF